MFIYLSTNFLASSFPLPIVIVIPVPPSTLNRPNSGNHTNNIKGSNKGRGGCGKSKPKPDKRRYRFDLSNVDLISSQPTTAKSRYRFGLPNADSIQDGLLQPRADSNSVNQGWKQTQAETDPVHLMPTSDPVGLPQPRSITDSFPPQSSLDELKPLLDHLKYAYLDQDQQFPVIIANNPNQEQEEKLLTVLWQHKKSIGWKLPDLPRINASICMHRIMMEEEAHPIQ
ncbi:hypothetical protein CR513_05891, partial [Mucuna pruriens]